MIDLERAQVALVHPDEPRAGVQGAGQLLLVVHLDQRGQAELVGQGGAPRQFGIGQRGGDQQHGVRAHQARVGHVGLLHGEVLAQHGQARGLAGRGQVGDRPAEEVDVRQDRQAGGAPCDVVLGHEVGLQSRVQVALGRGAALDLGDAREAVALQRSDEVPGRRRARRLFDQVGKGAAISLGAGPMSSENVRQVGGHDASA